MLTSAYADVPFVEITVDKELREGVATRSQIADVTQGTSRSALSAMTLRPQRRDTAFPCVRYPGDGFLRMHFYLIALHPVNAAYGAGAYHPFMTDRV